MWERRATSVLLARYLELWEGVREALRTHMSGTMWERRATSVLMARNLELWNGYA